MAWFEEADKFNEHINAPLGLDEFEHVIYFLKLKAVIISCFSLYYKYQVMQLSTVDGKSFNPGRFQ